MEAIRYGKTERIDVVLIDTAGRMQDNEPLMRALAKLIKVNEPDLVLFVGEALVGNEAVDQLVKFNQALADYSASDNPHMVDGIVLTKFDTIDDKVNFDITRIRLQKITILFFVFRLAQQFPWLTSQASLLCLWALAKRTLIWKLLTLRPSFMHSWNKTIPIKLCYLSIYLNIPQGLDLLHPYTCFYYDYFYFCWFWWNILQWNENLYMKNEFLVNCENDIYTNKDFYFFCWFN